MRVICTSTLSRARQGANRLSSRRPQDRDGRLRRQLNRKLVQDRPSGLVGLLLLDQVAAVEAVGRGCFIKSGPYPPVVPTLMTQCCFPIADRRGIVQHGLEAQGRQWLKCGQWILPKGML